MALPIKKHITQSYFRTQTSVKPTDYLKVSHSMSTGSITSSLYYRGGTGVTTAKPARFTLIQPRFDAYTGDRISNQERTVTLKQAHNAFSAALERFQVISHSLESAQHLINDMHYASSSLITGSF